MNQGIIVAFLSLLLYLTNLLGGGQGQPIQPINPPMEQQSYFVLGQSGQIVADTVTVRRSPFNEAEPLGTVTKAQAVTILDKSENWYKVRPNVGLEGWIPEYSVTITQKSPKTQGKIVLGYYPTGELAYESLLEHGSELTAIAPLGWQLDSYGGLEANFDPEAMGRSLYYAGNQEIETYAHLHVASNPSRLLTTTYLQQNTIASLLDTLENWGLKGILLDIAYVPGAEQPELFQFIDNLATQLNQTGLKTLLAVPWDSDIDYGAVSKTVDYLVLKNTMDHTSPNPGPLAAAPEVESMIEKIVQQVAPEKVILALANAGLDWPRAGLPTVLSHQEVLELAAAQGASVKWDAQSKSPFFNYGAGHEVWFENRYSMKYKFELANKYQLAGISLLGLGQEDPEIWGVLAKTL